MPVHPPLFILTDFMFEREGPGMSTEGAQNRGEACLVLRPSPSENSRTLSFGGGTLAAGCVEGLGPREDAKGFAKDVPRRRRECSGSAPSFLPSVSPFPPPLVHFSLD